MRYYMAPMEGITGFIFRNIHHELFPGMDRYYMPFIAPHTDGSLKSREKTDTDPRHNTSVSAIPQILSSHAESTILSARRLYTQGYREVNINLGCPYPTVVSKGKGAGALEDIDKLAHFLDALFSAPDMPAVSIKTRLRCGSEEEMDALFALYENYPLAELIIHPRRQRDFYKGVPDLNSFDRIYQSSRQKLCYNGNIYTPEDLQTFTVAHPAVDAVMIGRGLIRNPALVRSIQGGAALSMEEFHAFHDRLYQAYSMHLSGPAAILGHMKELWLYWETNLLVTPKKMKEVYKSRTCSMYEAAVSALLADAQIMEADIPPRKTAKLSL